jgi:hypothetical protein
LIKYSVETQEATQLRQPLAVAIQLRVEQIEILQTRYRALNKRYVMHKLRSQKVILQHMEKHKIV